MLFLKGNRFCSSTADLLNLQIIFGEPTYDPIINKIIKATKVLIFKRKIEIESLSVKKHYFLKTENDIENVLTNNNTKKSFGAYGHQYGTTLKTPFAVIYHP